MTATTLNKYRPFRTVDYSTTTHKIWAFIMSINIIYWLQRAPMFLLSLPAAYGVAAFMGTLLPMPFNIFAGLGFESVYLGCIALADQMYEEDDFTTYLWWTLNVLAVVVSALINTLFASQFHFNGIVPESFVHGLPLPILSFGYSLLLHKVTNRNAARDYKVAQAQAAIDLQKQQYALDNPHVCECGSRFKAKAGLSSHKRRSCNL